MEITQRRNDFSAETKLTVVPVGALITFGTNILATKLAYWEDGG